MMLIKMYIANVNIVLSIMHAMYKYYACMCTVQHDSEMYTYIYTTMYMVLLHACQQFNRC